MSGTLMPAPWIQVFNDDGTVAAGALLSFYVSGSSTPAAVYHDAALTVPWTQPVVCDSAGRAVIYLAAQAYKLIATTALGVPLGPTVDPLGSVGLSSAGVYTVFPFLGDEATAITSATYPVGATADTLHVGSGEFVMDSALLAQGTYKLSGMVSSVSAAVTTAALVNLSDGATETPIATISGSSATGTRVHSGVIPFAPGGVAKSYGIKVVSTGTGHVWDVALVKVPDILGSTGPVAVQTVFAFFGDPTSPITAGTYPSGATYDKCHAGTTWYVIDSATLPAGTYNLQGMLLALSAATVTVALVNLTDAADTPIVTISGSSATGNLVQSAPITFATGGAAKTYAIKAQCTGTGMAWGLQLIKTA